MTYDEPAQKASTFTINTTQNVMPPSPLAEPTMAASISSERVRAIIEEPTLNVTLE